MLIDLGDLHLWFDVSGPSVIAHGDAAVERPTLVAVHGGPGLDHIIFKAILAPLAEHAQESQREFVPVCYPLSSSKSGFADE